MRSEQQSGELLPRLLSRGDMLLLFVASVLSFPNSTLCSIIQEVGNASYLYWIIAAATFLVPSVIVMGQLHRFMPGDGAIYIWTHRALGEIWGFFAGFCTWLPGVLALLITGENAISSLQDMGLAISGPHASWLSLPWQQGLFILAFLVLTGWLSRFPLSLVMKFVKGATLLYLQVYLIIGLAGITWLLSGHMPQTLPASGHFRSGIESVVAPYALTILALFGGEVPLTMAAETRQRTAVSFALSWGTFYVVAASLLGTFGFLVVVPAHGIATYMEAVQICFGTPVAILLDFNLIVSFVGIGVALNLMFARILFVSALDYRLPTALAKLNRYAAPSRAMAVQVGAVAILVIMAYFLGPLLFAMDGATFSREVSDITVGTITITWCVSMIILFLDLVILLQRFRTHLVKHHDQLIVPRWVLYLCCTLGVIASLTGIIASEMASVDSQLFSDGQWSKIVSVVVLLLLAIGLLGSAYPRMVGNLDEQRAIARENARLYNELRSAYTRLSELDHLKDVFLATIDHELRTPLTVVQGSLAMLDLIEDTDPVMRRDLLKNARCACEELVMLLESIMDASRTDGDTIALHCTNISLKKLCMAVIELFETWLRQEQRPIKVDISEHVMVYADEVRIKQVLRNLLTNAMRYSAPRTPICIAATLEENQQMVSIQVIDHGLGIPPDKHEAIFEDFVRLERDSASNIRGSGLGLAITRQLVEAMHGTIRVQSSGINGEGSTFSFTLPVGSASP